MRLITILPLAAVLSACLCASAQQPGLQQGPKPAADLTSVPPAKLLAAAQIHNGAGEVPGEGWHIKATFDALVSANTLAYNTGTYEETWYAPQNYRRTFTYKGITHTDVATPDGLFRSGDQAWDTPDEVAVRHLLVSPLPLDPPGPDITLIVQQVTAGRVTIPCLFELWRMPPGLADKDKKDLIDHAPRICFDIAHPIVRFTAGIGSSGNGVGASAEVNLSEIAVIRNRAIAQEIVANGGEADAQGRPVPTLRIHVQEVNTPPDPTGPMVPPADSKKLTSPVTVSWASMELLRNPDPNRPVYPAGAIQEHLTGEVNIAVDIAPDGTITSAKIIDGIQMFRDSALDFVKKSSFKPFLLSGTPAEVHTTAHIAYGVTATGDEGSGRRH